jgi:hypothetical protein
MPTYRVEISDRYEQVVEEIYHTFQEAYMLSVIEVDAENAEEAGELARDGEGITISEEWEYGDMYDSEYCDSGDLVSSDFTERVIDNVISLEEEDRRRARDTAEIQRAISQLNLFAGKEPKQLAPPLNNPNWEV